jgi:hypothetical protein
MTYLCCLFDLTLRTKISICFSKYLYLPRPSRDCRTIRLSRFYNGLNADIKLDFDFSKGYLELSVKGVKNREVNSALQQIAYKQLNSKTYCYALNKHSQQVIY